MIDFDMEGNNEGDDNEVHIYFETGGTDMHVILEAGRTISWGNDAQSSLEIRGGGRVFLYLMGNNQLHFDDGYKIGVSGSSFQDFYIIALGGGSRLMSDQNYIKATVYMPNGERPCCSFITGRNIVQIESDEDNKDIRGIVVGDDIFFNGDEGSFKFYKDDGGSIKYGLPDYITFAGQPQPLSYFLVNEEEGNYNYIWDVSGTYVN
jgi:hypothetical protein